MVRVAMVINRYYPFVGGNETQCKLLSEELTIMGTNVMVITTHLREARIHENMNGINVYRVLPPVLFNKIMFIPTTLFCNFFLFLFLIIKRKEYDIIHAHQAVWYALGAVITAKLLRKKCIIKVSGSGPSGNMAFWSKSKFGSLAVTILKKANCIISLSEEINHELAQTGIHDNIITIHNGVKIELNKKYESDSKMNDLRKRYQNIAIYVGRLSKEKGVDILLKAWDEVRKQEYQGALVIIGDGPLRRNLELYSRTNLIDSIFFMGEQHNVVPYLQSSDIFILPSRAEGMSNALLEAMSVGLPCIASNIGGNIKLIKNKETGLTFESENPQSLVQCIIEMFQKKDLALELGNNAKEFIKKDFLIQVIATQYIKLYYGLINQDRQF